MEGRQLVDRGARQEPRGRGSTEMDDNERTGGQGHEDTERERRRLGEERNKRGDGGTRTCRGTGTRRDEMNDGREVKERAEDACEGRGREEPEPKIRRRRGRGAGGEGRDDGREREDKMRAERRK
ncbi:uncharacterized protein LOC134329613 [Trichomycterus rosablanca]|uniref:uncharacterized protein LOC134329613 n=1 Tax=Trichomycterus rosablanca TaxID=2290929 RepID=UPI002F35109D